VRVNCVALGITRTPSTEHWFRDGHAAMPEAMRQRYLLPRLGEPRDAAAAILFLASDAARWDHRADAAGERRLFRELVKLRAAGGGRSRRR
jgi:NAD(P)-dependent dehydrogenase (short-subunit alcohol dehydrogenase family)